MSEEVALALAAIMSAQIRMEGMKAMNQQREFQGQAQAYGEHAFFELSVDMRIEVDKFI